MTLNSLRQDVDAYVHTVQINDQNIVSLREPFKLTYLSDIGFAKDGTLLGAFSQDHHISILAPTTLESIESANYFASILD